MKITPMSAPSNTVAAPEGGAPSVRRLSMPTNATTPTLDTVPAQESVISDSNRQGTSESAEVTQQPLSPQLAAIAKQRRALQVKEREIAQREAMLSQPTSQGWIDPAKLQSDPLSVLLESGVTYDQLTEAILSSQGNQEINSLKAEIKALQEGVDKRFTDYTSQQEQQILSEMKREAEMLAKDDSFEMVRHTNSIPDVMELIDRTYKATGEVLDVAEAMRLVEDHLVEETLKIASLKKVKERITTPPSSPMAKSEPAMRTLTSRDNARVVQDRKARALAAFHGMLKK